MKVAVYVRVSTVEQNLDGQRLAINNWLEGNGVSARWYIDHGQSGDTMARPEFDRLQRDIFMGQINTVVVYKLDRLSRKLSDGINVLTGWLDKGVRVVSVTQQLDFSGATGQLVAAVLLAVAQMEQETRRERQAVGIEAAKKKGKYKGRKPGTNKGDVSKVAELKADGLSYTQIADKLSLSRSTVIRYMKIG
jgi:DNA invertase Pin-like site-specific DNA recombinase